MNIYINFICSMSYIHAEKRVVLYDLNVKIYTLQFRLMFSSVMNISHFVKKNI